ncbi:putative cyclase [Thozetella sp. PMI_491]|nr:putative cyclase [Thozetella sp. PMI_491]
MRRALPSFEELPLNESDPPFSAWGLWDNPALGTLNYLTDAVVLRTIKEEVVTGERVTLDLPLDAVKPGFLGRIAFEQKLINKAPRLVNDDIITFNTQTSSQWDSFRHFAYQEEGKFYNGVTQDDIYGVPNSKVNGSDGWTEKSIAGRGILLDLESWLAEANAEYRALSSYPITVDTIKAIFEKRKVQPRPGDILFIRTGYLAKYQGLDVRGKENLAGGKPEWPGLGQSEEMLRWLWGNQFSAIASDTPAMECVPPVDTAWTLHPILLSGWGTPIGELFDLEALAKVCKTNQRWSFFVTSAPLKYNGSVASPPNAIAIL